MLIRTLSDWDISGQRVSGLPGVWIGGQELAKIAAIGVKIRHGVTMHGFALNVAMDLSPFRLVMPCGIQNCRVTSMANALGQDVEIERVRQRIAEVFAEIFGIEWTEHIMNAAAIAERWPIRAAIDVDKGTW